MSKIKTIVLKEWAEVFKNRLVLFTVAFLPLVFIALPLITLGATNTDTAETVSVIEEDADLGLPGTEELCEGLNSNECLNAYMLNLYGLLFMILPVAIPVTIAAYSIVGEKTTRSLEPLLATPITTVELLVGKALSAIIPALIATWVGYAVYAIAVYLMAGAGVFGFVVQPLWLVAVFVVGPLLTVLSVNVAIMISSRVNDPRVAEQLSMVVILPIIMGIVGQSFGLVLIDGTVILIIGVVVALLDVVLVYVGIRAFQRETILTKWK